MDTSETLIGSETLRTMAMAGVLEKVTIRKDEDGFSLHIKTGNLSAQLQTKRGEPKVCAAMETLANLLNRLGIEDFAYENNAAPAKKGPVQEKLFVTGRRRPGKGSVPTMTRKSA